MIDKDESEKIQNEVNQIREVFIKECPLDVQNNFAKIEAFVKWLDENNLPFLFVVNPFGYDFDNSNEAAQQRAGKGFWQYNKCYPNDADPFSQEGNKILLNCLEHASHSVLKVLSYSLRDREFGILKGGKVKGFYVDGKYIPYNPSSTLKKKGFGEN